MKMGINVSALVQWQPVLYISEEIMSCQFVNGYYVNVIVVFEVVNVT